MSRFNLYQGLYDGTLSLQSAPLFELLFQLKSVEIAVVTCNLISNMSLEEYRKFSDIHLRRNKRNIQELLASDQFVRPERNLEVVQMRH